MDDKTNNLSPRTLTVVIANTEVTLDAIVIEEEHRPYIRRTVQIELTPEQRQALELKKLSGRPSYEEVLECWLEPVDTGGDQ